MNIKKLLPAIITAVLSIFAVIFSYIFSQFPENVKPISLLGKLGIYTEGALCTVENNDVFTNGTHELYTSLLKKFAVNNTFNIAISFTIISILFVTALIIISKAASKTNYKWTAYVCAILLPFVFGDFTNTAFFKTFYINSLILVTLLLICSVFMLIYHKNSIGPVGVISVGILTVIYSCLGVVSAITAIILGLLIARLYTISKNKTTKIIAVIMGCFIVLQSIAFVFTYKSVDYEQNIYNSVFYGVAKYDSVSELGLDPKLDELKNTYYNDEIKVEYDLDNTFYNKISYTDIAKYYITHPTNAYKIINEQSKLSAMHYYNFGISPYNFIKTRIPTGLPIVAIVTIAFLFIANILRKKYIHIKPIVEFLAGISVMWLLSLIVGSIYYGNCDMAMNMTVYNTLYDIVLLIILIGGTRVVLHRQDEKKAEFGITHE